MHVRLLLDVSHSAFSFEFARRHYKRFHSISVSRSVCRSIRLFWIYHTMANSDTSSQKRSSLSRTDTHFHLNRVIWFRIFDYFECNVKGILPRQYGWPLPWPRHWASKFKEFDWGKEAFWLLNCSLISGMLVIFKVVRVHSFVCVYVEQTCCYCQ